MNNKIKKIIIIAVCAVVLIGVGVAVAFHFYKVNKNAPVAETTQVNKSSSGKTNNFTASITDGSLVMYDNDIWEDIKKNPDRWGSRFTNWFGMSESEKNSALEGPENGEWICYNLTIVVDNPNETENNGYFGLEINNNGENGVYIDTHSDGAVVLSQGKQDFVLNVFVHNNELSTDDVFELIKSMDIIVKSGPLNFSDNEEAEIIKDEDIIYVKVDYTA